jgi:hypothetical protein
MHPQEEPITIIGARLRREAIDIVEAELPESMCKLLAKLAQAERRRRQRATCGRRAD